MGIGLFLLTWFAVGFLVALALGKILREANEVDDLDLHVAEPSSASINHLHHTKRKSKRRRKSAASNAHKDANRVANRRRPTQPPSAE